MERIKALLTEQPALITAVVEGGFAVLMAFGLNWTAEQVATVMAFINLVGGIVIYALVMPMSKVRRIMEERDTATAQAEHLRGLVDKTSRPGTTPNRDLNDPLS